MSAPRVPGVPGMRLPPNERERELLEQIRAESEKREKAEQIVEHLKLQQARYDGEREARSRSVFPSASTPKQRASTMAAVVIAVCGSGGLGAGLVKFLQPPDLNAAKLESIHSDLKAQSGAVGEIREHLRTAHARDADRWAIVETVLCAHNSGKPFARGVDCGAVALDPQPIGAPKLQLPAYRTDQAWPFAARPP